MSYLPDIPFRMILTQPIDCNSNLTLSIRWLIVYLKGVILLVHTKDQTNEIICRIFLSRLSAQCRKGKDQIGRILCARNLNWSTRQSRVEPRWSHLPSLEKSDKNNNIIIIGKRRYKIRTYVKRVQLCNVPILISLAKDLFTHAATPVKLPVFSSLFHWHTETGSRKKYNGFDPFFGHWMLQKKTAST